MNKVARWSEALDYSGFDYTLDRIAFVGRELAEIKDRMRQFEASRHEPPDVPPLSHLKECDNVLYNTLMPTIIRRTESGSQLGDQFLARIARIAARKCFNRMARSVGLEPTTSPARQR